MDESIANQVSLHVPRMYRVACRVLGDAERARDVVQQACLLALSKMDTFDGRASLATWLHRITANCAHDALRSEGRKRRAQAVLQSQPDRDAAPCPSVAAETKELSDLAWGHLENLPEDCRSAFALTQLDGYSYDEAAEIEGESRGTIASRVWRAKKVLLREMNAHLVGRSQHDE